MENLYTYEEAANILGLARRSSVQRRIESLAKRGAPLTVAAGDYYEIGARRLLTDAGLAKLRGFEPGKSGRPVEKSKTATVFESNGDGSL